jgi:disulfide bond formation protein DsbB
MNWLKKNSAYIAWTTALLATLGSLYFQYILDLPPCVLCWYQRIAMYPLVIIIGIGILKRDLQFWMYALPFSIIGLAIAIYHNLLYYKILPESVAPCTEGISCTTKQIELLGFITIPLLSLIAFTVITVLLLIYKKSNYAQRS